MAPSTKKIRTIVIGLLFSLFVFSGCVRQEEISRDFQSNRRASHEKLSRTVAVAKGGGNAERLVINELEIISGDLDIDACVELAFVHNKEIQTSKIHLQEAIGQTVEARSTALPQASFNGSAIRNDDDSLFGQKESYQLGLLVRQPLYLGGLIGTALDAAAVFSYQTQQELRKTCQKVQLTVRKEYLAILLAKELVDVARQAKANAQELLTDTQKKYRLGVGTKFEVLRAQVRVKDFDARLIRFQNGYKLAKNRLLNTLGVSQMSHVSLTDALTFGPITVDSDMCLLRAMEKRPELLIGESYIRLAKDNVLSEQAGNRPNVFLQGQYTRSYPGLGSTVDFGDIKGERKWDRSMNAGIVVEWAFFDGLATRGRVIKAKAILDQQKVALRKQEQQVQLEVTQSLLNLESNQRFVASQDGRVEDATEALRLAKVGFREGTTTSLDVISAELALAEAQSDYYQAVHNYMGDQLDLSASIGIIGEEPLGINNTQ
ncbi:MAG: TolC family protein [Phycisphaerae bacterium]|nr:TolC family protein [Phycisphaerae bacterium]